MGTHPMLEIKHYFKSYAKGVKAADDVYLSVDSGDIYGFIGLMIGAASNFDLPTTEGEIGYWIGVLY